MTVCPSRAFHPDCADLGQYINFVPHSVVVLNLWGKWHLVLPHGFRTATDYGERRTYLPCRNLDVLCEV